MRSLVLLFALTACVAVPGSENPPDAAPDASWEGRCGEGLDPCPEGEFCDDPTGACARFVPGYCTPIPTDCSSMPVCGCDRTVYDSPCEAAAAGVDQRSNDACSTPSGLFECGDHYCTAATQYCYGVMDESEQGGATRYSCQELPAECAGTASCDCLDMVACGNGGPSPGSCRASGSGFTVFCDGD